MTLPSSRVAAAVADNPYAADFDMRSFVELRAPLALVTTGHDHRLRPEFHGERVLAACTRREHLARLPAAGHGHCYHRCRLG